MSWRRRCFRALSETDVQRVTDEITRLGEVPATQLTQVLTEFYGLLETQQYMVRGGPEYALKVLTEAFGCAEGRGTSVAGEEDSGAQSNGDMARLQKMDPQQLSKFLENEHPQTVALVLAHLDAKRGSMVLMHLQRRCAWMWCEGWRRCGSFRRRWRRRWRWCCISVWRDGDGWEEVVLGLQGGGGDVERLDQSASKGILEEIETERAAACDWDSRI